MTCIIASICTDGIVIVGDKRVTAGDMSFCQDKIISVKSYENMVVAAAGTVLLRQKFVNDLNNLDLLIKKRIIREDPSRQFVGLIEDIVARLCKTYYPRLGDDYSFSALVCHKPKTGKPWLFRVDDNGCASEITKVDTYCIIGTGEMYGHLFIRPVFPEYGDMEGMAIIATFIIHLIDKMRIDNTIGPDEDGNVQVWYFPNDSKPKEIKGQALRHIVKEAENRLSSFADLLVLGKTSRRNK